jgi:hypothetical protein
MEASDAIKLQWWMKLIKSLTIGAWAYGKKLSKPCLSAELVYKTYEENIVTYRDFNGKEDTYLKPYQSNLIEIDSQNQNIHGLRQTKSALKN